MSETLTLDDLKVLQRPFPVAAHTFNKRGFCYVKEDEVTARIEEVDPAWQFEIVGEHRTGTGDQFAVVVARMTIKGVTRGSTGMQAVEYTNQKDAQGKTIGKTDVEAGEAEKGADTDALRRCARRFGIGRYILAMGDSVKNHQQLEVWLKQRYGTSSNGNGQAHGELKISGVTAVKMVEKNGKPCVEAAGVTFWTREPFRQAGYSADEWNKPGTTYHLKEVPFTVYYTVNDKGFKTGVKVEAD